jgi:hypothetical protein
MFKDIVERHNTFKAKENPDNIDAFLAHQDREKLLQFAWEARHVINLAYQETGLVDCRKFLEDWDRQ